MRALLSTIGSRGDVQPLVALGSVLRARGHGVRLCVPPDFRGWLEGLGFEVVGLGPQVRATGKAPATVGVPTAEQRRAMIAATVAMQFRTVGEAARGCDAIVAATALQVAAPSIAQLRGIPHVFVAYCPAVLPSRHHAPPVLGMLGDAPAGADDDVAARWEADARRWNEDWGEAIATQRAELGLAAVEDVRGHVLTPRPWLAADPALAPWPQPSDLDVVQTGAWVLPDARPLDDEVEAFVDAGDPPVYFGFGSIRAPGDLAATMLAAARAVGRRAIVSRGWAELSVGDADDCLVIGEVNQSRLFPRVAAVVHHGGAGTTTAAARAGAPQVVIPQMYDQHYWAGRIAALQVGVAHAPGTPTVASLTAALQAALAPDVAMRAQALAADVRDDGAEVAADRLEALVGP